jgi:AcrR family transcriptional regulator
VAREAGVSPAAPYHHFKDKGELLAAVAREGWMALNEAIGKARRESKDPRHALTEIGVAYVCFAREHPALYRTMYDSASDQSDMPDHAKDGESGWSHVREVLIEAGVDPQDERGLELATISAWCSAHGVAEMCGFKDFGTLKEALGGEEAFIRAIFDHLGIYARHARVAIPA